MCPICGNSVPKRNFKIRSKFKFPSNSFKVNICKDHFELKEKSLKKKIPLYFIAFSFLLVLFLLILSIFLKNRLLTNTAYIVLYVTFNFFILFSVIEELREYNFIRKHIFIESFREGCAISVKNEHWAAIFKEKNFL